MCDAALAREQEVLAELAEMGLSLARKVYDQAMASEDGDETAKLTLAFHTLSRSIRQTYALKARLQREAAKGLEAARTAAHKAQVKAREGQVRQSLERLIWTEYEKDEAKALQDDLDVELLGESLSPSFLTEEVEALIARLCKKIEIDPPARVEAPEPPGPPAGPPAAPSSG